MSWLTRTAEFVTTDDGRLEQSLVWSNVGKAAAVWLLWKHADAVLNHTDVAAVLLAFIILPDMARRIIESKWPEQK